MTELETMLDIMTDSLRKKRKVLSDIMDANTKQAKALKENDDYVAFDECIETKKNLITELQRLDVGFQTTFDRIKEELNGNKEQYADKIQILKNLISDITALSVQIEAGEKRNKALFTQMLATRRREVTTTKRSVKAANDYYKIMNKMDPQLDKRFNAKQ